MNEQEELDAARVSVRDITAILRVAISVDSFQYDSSIMEHPEFLISTLVVFQCQQFGGKQLCTQWRIFRTFDEFQGLDAQLRATFPLLMANIKPPRVHRRRAFFRVNKRKAFLARRCTELNDYLQRLLATSTMRLSRFLDPRAPLVLRCFCNFDAGFGLALTFQSNQYESCVLCLDHVADETVERKSADDRHALSQVADVDASVKSQEWELQQQQMLREQWRAERLRSGSRYDALEANLLDDRARNLAMCLKFECSCQYSSFHVTHNKMARILQQHGYRQVYRPLEGGATALCCVLYRLQQFNDLDKRLYDAMTGFPEKGADTTHEQLTRGVEILRHALANYGLLHIHALEVEFRMNAVDLKKKLHEFKSRHQHRVGAMELVLLATMLDLSIGLITNDHDGTTQRIEPFSQDGTWTPIRLGGRIHLTLGYILPTIFNVNGFYLLAEPVAERPPAADTIRERSRPPSVDSTSDDDSIVTVETTSENIIAAPAMLDLETRRRMWLGVEEMDRCLIGVIDAQMRSDLAWIGARFFDHDVAETLNKAILDAVWDDCQHNPNLFHLFQKQARQFGKSRTSAHFFFQYLEVAFGMEGAAYLVDFLLHVLPEEELRKQLLRARWFRVRRHLTKRVAPVHALAAQLTQEASQFHQLSKDQSRIIEKVAGSLDLRAKCLSAVDGERMSPTKDDMEDILEASTVQVVEETDDLVDDESLMAAATATATTAARRPRRKGETYLDLFLDKIGLKDASTYTNPTLVISIFDRDGNAMEEKHETSVGSCSEPQHVSFHARIQLETSRKDMDERGAAIFFEFYHYKPKKRRQSCRCWTLLEMDEVAAAADGNKDDGSNALVLELYQKPMDPKRKRIH